MLSQKIVKKKILIKKIKTSSKTIKQCPKNDN